MACRICGRVLDYDERTGYQHTFGDSGADHAPDPAPVDEALVIGRCDFCYVDFPKWVIPARDFEVLPGHMSSGGWAACDACVGFVEKNQWTQLVRRAVEGWSVRHGMPMSTEMVESLPRLFRLLRKNISGAAVPNPDAVTDAGLARLDPGEFGTGTKKA